MKYDLGPGDIPLPFPGINLPMPPAPPPQGSVHVAGSILFRSQL